jgi:hypothetical protein
MVVRLSEKRMKTIGAHGEPPKKDNVPLAERARVSGANATEYRKATRFDNPGSTTDIIRYLKHECEQHHTHHHS